MSRSGAGEVATRPLGGWLRQNQRRKQRCGEGALEEEGVWGKAKGRPSVCRDACNEPARRFVRTLWP